MKLAHFEHPYYMTEGNYRSNDCHMDYNSLEEFLSDWKDADKDFNRIHRWDICLEEMLFKVYYVLQRKADLRSCFVKITPDDEKTIIEFLKPHKDLNEKLWAGI